MRRLIRSYLFPTIIAATLVACGVPTTSGNENYAKSSQSDRRFQEQVETIMPGYALSAEIVGVPLRISDGYALSFTPSSVALADRDERIRDYIQRFEDTGASPFRVYFRAGLSTLGQREYWRLDFVGCMPRRCISNLTNSRFVRVSADQFSKYDEFGPDTKYRAFKVHASEIDGVAYEAYANVLFDSRGRVMKYYITSYRNPSNRAEARIGQGFSNSDGPNVPTFRYARNVVLKLDGQTWSPLDAPTGVDTLIGL